MALLFLIAGVLFFAAAINNKTDALITTIKGDFTGPKNFFIWALAIGGVLGLQYIPGMRRISYALFVLVMLSLVLSHSDTSGNNIITKFFDQIKATQQ